MNNLCHDDNNKFKKINLLKQNKLFKTKKKSDWRNRCSEKIKIPDSCRDYHGYQNIFPHTYI